MFLLVYNYEGEKEREERKREREKETERKREINKEPMVSCLPIGASPK
jgi:hypothetical protein